MIALFSKPIALAEYEDVASHVYERGGMHTRKVRQVKKSPDDILNMVRVQSEVIEGCLSGKYEYLKYQFIYHAGHLNLDVFEWDGELKRVQFLVDRLWNDLVARVEQEQSDEKFYPKYAKGRFYLRRRATGMKIDHPNAIRAKLKGYSPSFLLGLDEYCMMVVAP